MKNLRKQAQRKLPRTNRCKLAEVCKKVKSISFKLNFVEDVEEFCKIL